MLEYIALNKHECQIIEEEDSMSSPIKPMAQYVVAQTEKKPAKTASGIYLPESAQEKSEAAVVVAVGSGVKDVAVKDKVIYKNYSATTVKYDGDEYLVIKDEDILATVTAK